MARKTNETYTIKIASPLLRPGLTITTQVSKGYLVQTVKDLLDLVREINTPPAAPTGEPPKG